MLSPMRLLWHVQLYGYEYGTSPPPSSSREPHSRCSYIRIT